MRNLKRAFSLVLALVMVVSMITIAPVAAADETAPATVTSNFSDAAEIEYTEAVAITGGIGLFAGADGKFMPKGTVTRAQMATIIVKMLYGGDANADGFKGNGKFSDTADFEGGWAEGYINWCSTLGVVAGYGDGTFRPGNQVTTAEAATMILNALKIDAGEGTWPTTVMSKAEEEDLFEDLKPMPGTNTALTREELAVIALNGLNWSDSEETGWYVTGGAADQKMTFESFKDAQAYATAIGNGASVQPLEGRDSLANKVYDLKKATGWITANQGSGEKYTEVSVWENNSKVPTKFNVVTDYAMIGHKVEVWYEEAYTSEKEPGLTYAIAEAAEYITLTEKADTAKKYKAAFGTKYDLPNDLIVTDGTFNVANGGSIAPINNVSYVANNSAPVGTYVIDNETGALCGYIAPVAYQAAKVTYIDTTADNEKITVGPNTWNNSVDNDDVVEYDGIAKDDYVTYVQVQNTYVLTKMDSFTGVVTKYATNDDGNYVITVDDKQYTASTATCYISAKKPADIPSIDHQQTYTFYLAPDGTFVCFEAVEGSNFDMSRTAFLLDAIRREVKGDYGKKAYEWYARGVDMNGNEVMILIGAQTDKNVASTKVGKTAIEAKNAFYTVEASKVKEEKELGIMVLTKLPTAATAENPTYTYNGSNGRTEAEWQPGGKFEYGVSHLYGGNTGLDVYSFNQKTSKYILVEGTATQDYPLETAVTTGSVKVYFAAKRDCYYLLTRQANGVNNIEAVVIPTEIQHASNALMVYVPVEIVMQNGVAVKQDLTPSGTTATGNVFSVYNGTNGTAMEITLDSSITSLAPGFYSVGYDAVKEQHLITSNAAKVIPGTTDLATLKTQDYKLDGRRYENVCYDQELNAYNGSNLFFNSKPAASIATSKLAIVDTRDEETINRSGIAKITSVQQIMAMKETHPGVHVTLDLCTDQNGAITAMFIEVDDYSKFGLSTVVYGKLDLTTNPNANTVNTLNADATLTVVNSNLKEVGSTMTIPAGTTVRFTSHDKNAETMGGFYWVKPIDEQTTELVAVNNHKKNNLPDGTRLDLAISHHKILGAVDGNTLYMADGHIPDVKGSWCFDGDACYASGGKSDSASRIIKVNDSTIYVKADGTQLTGSAGLDYIKSQPANTLYDYYSTGAGNVPAIIFEATGTTATATTNTRYVPTEEMVVYVENSFDYEVGGTSGYTSYMTPFHANVTIDGQPRTICVNRLEGTFAAGSNMMPAGVYAVYLDAYGAVWMKEAVAASTGNNLAGASAPAADLDLTNGAYVGAEYVAWEVYKTEKQTMTVITACGTKTADSNTLVSIPSNVSAVIDNSNLGVTVANFAEMAAAKCLVYTSYTLNDGTTMVVVASEATGTAYEPVAAADLAGLDDSNTTVLDRSGSSITNVTGLTDKLTAGYTVFLTKYSSSNGTTLLITKCAMAFTTKSGTIPAGVYTLFSDREADALLKVAAGTEVTIDLNGYTLSMSSTATTTQMIDVRGKLTIKDSSSAQTGTIKGTDNSNGTIASPGNEGVVTANPGSVVTLESGTIVGRKLASGTGNFAGAVRVTGGTFNMTGGKITGGYAKQGGGIYAGTAGSVINISGGEISGNTAIGGGGGIHVTAGTTVTIEGSAKITGNTGSEGGGISANNANDKVYIKGGEITGNTTTARAANIYAYAATYEISGGTIDAGLYNGAAAGNTFRSNQFRAKAKAVISGGNIAKLDGATNEGLGSIEITGNPVIGWLSIHATNTTTKTIGKLTPDASVTTSTADALTIVSETPETVAHVAGSTLYTYKG